MPRMRPPESTVSRALSTATTLVAMGIRAPAGPATSWKSSARTACGEDQENGVACRMTPRITVPAGTTRPEAAASTVNTADTGSPGRDVALDTPVVSRT